MVRVSLVNWLIGGAAEAISHAAKTCYEDTAPQWGKVIDIEGRLWSTGHHTTFQHFFCTFLIENIAIGDITFGMHLANPFYNTSQRSGRFCAKMFTEPDFDEIENYIGKYWPEIKNKKDVMDYIALGLSIYQSNIEKAREQAEEFIKQERPNASDKYVEQNAPKIAQEQMRMFIPVVFPTALTYTVNISALAAMYRSAWSPALMDVTQKMADLVVEKWPELSFAFRRKTKVNPSIVEKCTGFSGVRRKPVVRLESSGDASSFSIPESEDLHPVDLLHFSPHLMDNNTREIKTEVELSVATMGQDQRHRTIRRSKPCFTGSFYLPPIPDSLGLANEAENVFNKWLLLQNRIPESLICILAPYGAMVRYQKVGSYNAVVHELSKRLCWCAQEEIYHLTRSLREQLGNHPIINIMAPNCVLTGKCGEGVRYCGRDMKKTKSDPFSERKV